MLTRRPPSVEHRFVIGARGLAPALRSQLQLEQAKRRDLLLLEATVENRARGKTR